MLFKISNLNSNLALILGYLNPALNNSALLLNQPNIKKGGRRKQIGSLSTVSYTHLTLPTKRIV